MLRFLVASRSEMGARKTNEDAIHVSREAGCLLTVLADGAGGHRGGATASHVAVYDLDANLHGADWFEAAALDTAVREAHHSVRRAQGAGDALGRMHTTIVALWLDVDNGRALWSHVGDSRLYLIRSGRCRQLTVDDSVVQQMLDAGLLTPKQAEAHPQKNQLVAALGMDGNIEPQTSAETYAVRGGDVFLLCSDGWWGALSTGQMIATLGSVTHPEAWLRTMQREIEAQSLPHQDNFSGIAVWVVDDDDDTQPMPVRLGSTAGQ